MNSIFLYTINCPKCLILEKKLEAKNICYNKITSEEIMRKRGFDTLPVIEFTDGRIMEFKEANDWINNYKFGEDY